MKNFVFSDNFHQIFYVIPVPSTPAPCPRYPCLPPPLPPPPPPLSPYPRSLLSTRPVKNDKEIRLWHFLPSEKLILQMRMRSHPVGLDVWFLVGYFVYFRTSCVRTAKALAWAFAGRLCDKYHNLMSWLIYPTNPWWYSLLDSVWTPSSWYPGMVSGFISEFGSHHKDLLCQIYLPCREFLLLSVRR